MDGDETYDTPWEYAPRSWARVPQAPPPPQPPAPPRSKLVTARRDGASAVLSATGFVQTVCKGRKSRKSPSTPISPLPGLRTKSRQQSREKPRVKRADASECPRCQVPGGVWEPRGPEADSRDPADYEVPWEQKRLSLSTRGIGDSLSVALPAQPRPASQTYERIWDCSSALPGESGDRNSASPRDTSSASPASSSSTWSSSGSKESKSSLSSSVSSQDAAPPPGLVRPWPPAHFAGSPQHAQTTLLSALSPAQSSGSSTTLAKTPATPIIETVFVSAPPVSSRPRSGLSQEEEEREKAIQRLCQDLEGLPAPPPQPTRRPFPPASASLLPPHRPSAKAPSLSPAGPCVYDNVADSIPTTSRTSLSPRSPKPVMSPVPPTSISPSQPIKESGEVPDYDVPWEFCSQKKLSRLLQKRVVKNGGSVSGVDRSRLRLELGGLEMGDGLHSSPSEEPTTGPLEVADWFHGRVTRVEAERRLASAPTGAYLVRLCEPHRRSRQASNPPPEYALSLKSAAGFMHMKIQQRVGTPTSDPTASPTTHTSTITNPSVTNPTTPVWVLGYFSSPFASIPEMLSYYTSHKLPIKGADHLSLKHPVKEPIL